MLLIPGSLEILTACAARLMGMSAVRVTDCSSQSSIPVLKCDKKVPSWATGSKRREPEGLILQLNVQPACRWGSRPRSSVAGFPMHLVLAAS